MAPALWRRGTLRSLPIPRRRARPIHITFHHALLRPHILLPLRDLYSYLHREEAAEGCQAERDLSSPREEGGGPRTPHGFHRGECLRYQPSLLWRTRLLRRLLPNIQRLPEAPLAVNTSSLYNYCCFSSAPRPELHPQGEYRAPVEALSARTKLRLLSIPCPLSNHPVDRSHGARLVLRNLSQQPRSWTGQKTSYTDCDRRRCLNPHLRRYQVAQQLW